jgi:PhnB protein
MQVKPSLVPLLVVRNARQAIDFYARALGAQDVVRYDNKVLGTISHADLTVGAAVFSITEELPEWNSIAPPTRGGSAVVLQYEVDDAAAALARMCDAGAVVVFPLQEFCGELMTRVRDPFGHLWILCQRIEVLSREENQARRDRLFAELAAARGIPATGPATPKNEEKDTPSSR